MENNESMNLGGMATSGFAQNLNQTQPVAPVFGQTSTTGTNETITINTPAQEIPAQTIGQTQNMHSQVVSGIDTSGIIVDTTRAENVTVSSAPEPPVQAEAQPEQVKPHTIMRDEFLVPVAILQKLVSKARKVGTYDQVRTVSQVIEIELGDFGIRVKASNGNLDYQNIDDNIKYTGSLKACVDIAQFGNLVNELDCEEVLLQYENSVLTVINPNTEPASRWPFPARIDLATQQVIELGLTFDMAYEDMTPVDFKAMVDVINEARPVRNLPQIDKDFAGVYFGNLVLSSDRNIVYMQDNQRILKTQKFFINKEFCDLITSIDFNSNNFRIGFTTNSVGEISALTLSDGKMVVCGNTDPIPENLNVSACESFWDMKFASSITINTKKFVNALKRVRPFMRNTNDNEFNSFEVSANSIRIIPDEASVVDTVMVTNPTGFKGTFRLHMTKMEMILNTIKPETFSMLVDPENDAMICLVIGDYKWIVAVGDNG